MLARARDRAAAAGPDCAARLELVEADIAALDLGRPFGLAFIALNTLAAPRRSEQPRRPPCGALADHLAPGGLAVVDVWLPDADDLARYDGRLFLEYVRTDPETGRTIVKTGSALHDAATQIVTLTSIFDEAGQGEPPIRWIRRDRIRLVGRR